MNGDKIKYGIEGHQAPEWRIPLWIDSNGEETTPKKLSDFTGTFKVLYCFQSWCPGCHSVGLPSLQKMVDSLTNNTKVKFFAIQTVFEGIDENTYEKILETQNRYNLPIPFGHDAGDKDSQNISQIMYNYRTGGTPWFIFIDQMDTVVFNDFHLNTEKAIEFLMKIS